MPLKKLRQDVYVSLSQVTQYDHRRDAVFMGAIDHYSSYKDPDYFERYELYRLLDTTTVGARYGNAPEEYESGGAGLFMDMGFFKTGYINTPVAIATRALILKRMDPKFYKTYLAAVQSAIL